VGGDFHLAQVNIAIPKEPPGGPLLREFMAALDPVNALADTSPGFVWRLQDEDGNATAIRAFDEDTMVNMSVWESLEALRAFVYSNRAHLDIMRRRREWFHDHAEAFQALWWVPAGHIPTVGEAEDRLQALRTHGPSPEAFTFRRHFPPPSDGRAGAGVDDDRRLCPAG
jgi:heme-degrading monooxygenase HmoA